MAYKKLTDLTEIVSVDNADLFEIVDTSDTTQDPAEIIIVTEYYN